MSAQTTFSRDGKFGLKVLRDVVSSGAISGRADRPGNGSRHGRNSRLRIICRSLGDSPALS